MSFVKLLPAAACAAIVLSACGTSAKPVAGSIPPTATTAGHARVDDPRTTHVPCLRAHHLQVTEQGQTNLLIGTAPGGPTVTFTPTPGAAQAEQITSRIGSAEVIGNALLFPHQAPDTELKVIEDCLAQGVSG
ncbi:MAG TPA: hypothetical protein VMU39_24650 [Solirubrobacteraceae bacterium]|nr:hypothetical protein [Solirubrobacteraceae bacterium]